MARLKPGRRRGRRCAAPVRGDARRPQARHGHDDRRGARHVPSNEKTGPSLAHLGRRAPRAPDAGPMAHTHATPAAANRNRLAASRHARRVQVFELVGGIAATASRSSPTPATCSPSAGIGLTLFAIGSPAAREPHGPRPPAPRDPRGGRQRDAAVRGRPDVLVEAWPRCPRRRMSPRADARGRAVGLLANSVSLVLLRDAERESLTMRGAYLEVIGDLGGRWRSSSPPS